MVNITDKVGTNETNIASNTSALATAGAYEIVATKTVADKQTLSGNDYVAFDNLEEAKLYKLLIRNLTLTADAKQVGIRYIDDGGSIRTSGYGTQSIRSASGGVYNYSTSSSDHATMLSGREAYTSSNKAFFGDVDFFNINSPNTYYTFMQYQSSFWAFSNLSDFNHVWGSSYYDNVNVRMRGIVFTGSNSTSFSTGEFTLLKMK